MQSTECNVYLEHSLFFLYQCPSTGVWSKRTPNSTLFHFCPSAIPLNREKSFFSNYKAPNRYYLFAWCVCPSQNISLIWRHHNCLWMVDNFDLLSSVLMAIEKWGFFSVSHLLWHRTIPFIRLSQRTCISAKCLAAELSLPVLRTEKSVAAGTRTITSHMRDLRSTSWT